MRRLAVACVFLQTMAPMAALAQEPSPAQPAALQQVVDEQARRIQALEARLAQLQQEVDAILGRPPQPAVLATVDEHHEPPPYEHAYGGEPPSNPDGEAPASDLPRALNIDTYGSLRVLAATDTKGHSEVLNNFSRLGIRGEKPLFGDDFVA